MTNEKKLRRKWHWKLNLLLSWLRLRVQAKTWHLTFAHEGDTWQDFNEGHAEVYCEVKLKGGIRWVGVRRGSGSRVRMFWPPTDAQGKIKMSVEVNGRYPKIPDHDLASTLDAFTPSSFRISRLTALSALNEKKRKHTPAK